jgi:hypothetical protein
MANNDLQELYRHLEHHSLGLMYMAYYGQCRANGSDHLPAIAETLIHFNIPDNDWYWLRFQNEEDKRIVLGPKRNRLLPQGKTDNWILTLRGWLDVRAEVAVPLEER